MGQHHRVTLLPRYAAGLLAAAASMLLAASPAGATSRDFIDETVVSQRFEAREVGLEFGTESRLDADYRLQGWYSWELEFAPLSRALLEGVAQVADRGNGLRFGGWRAGGRLLIGTLPRWPAEVSVAAELETQTTAGKHPTTEREIVPRLVLTQRFPGAVLATANLGFGHRLEPTQATKFVYGLGVRYPEGAPLMAGLEFSRQPLERSARLAPQLWVALPRRLRLRLGGIFDMRPRPYWFVARGIVEAEF